MYYLIYKLTNINTGKYIKRAIEKYGKDSFTKEILFMLEDEATMWLKEAELVNEEFLITSNTYNIKLGGNGGFSSEEAKKGRARTNGTLEEKYGKDW